jgi:cytochrome P450 family 6
LAGTPVDVRETMAKYTLDVIASCAFGIQSNSLKHSDAEFWRHLRNIFHFSVKKGLVALLWFFVPSLTAVLKLKFLDDRTTDYLRRTVWSTVEYRSVMLYICILSHMLFHFHFLGYVFARLFNI